jgi:predicted nuclease with TOPRIM domain
VDEEAPYRGKQFDFYDVEEIRALRDRVRELEATVRSMRDLCDQRTNEKALMAERVRELEAALNRPWDEKTPLHKLAGRVQVLEALLADVREHVAWPGQSDERIDCLRELLGVKPGGKEDV